MTTTAETYLLKKWVYKAENAGLFGGYPIGSAYADPRLEPFYYGLASRCASFDSLIARKLPHMRGKYLSDVKSRISELEANQ